ncbi:MAG TPA: UDP-N-acetylglucosamine 2-epimerase (non-hydrolyzing) [Stellaceae bacterium]|nr:UDP-N-acetylglucosamine 2-epimerase (non-hydrolyzing) [Stellaceae bacterium]
MDSVHLIVAARPNFMKMAPLWHALREERWCRPILVHTGQHYDADMSDAFFRDLALPPPHHNLGAGSGSHAQQTAAVMVAYEALCMEQPPDWVVVAGDVNSTLACTITAKKLLLPVCHLEAGLRSFDRTMPEEINRIVTDVLADLLWTPSPDADANLRREGIPADRIERVGNIMIDSLVMLRARIAEARAAQRLGLASRGYGVVTLHRPSNVDDPQTLERAVAALERAAEHVPLVFPMHPRTRESLRRFGMADRLGRLPRITPISPLGYVEFMSLLTDAALAITDSGGIQEETTYLGIPCLTVRRTTERPITVTHGTNRLVTWDDLAAQVAGILAAPSAPPEPPPLWDGHTAARVCASLKAAVERRRSTTAPRE